MPGSVPANQAPPDDSEEDPYAELRQDAVRQLKLPSWAKKPLCSKMRKDAPVGMDEPIPGSNRLDWKC